MKNYPFHFDARFDIDNKNIYVKNAKNNYVKYDMANNKFIEKEIDSYFTGGRTIIVKGDKYYRDVETFIQLSRCLYRDYLDYSFDVCPNRSLVLCIFTKGSVRFFEYMFKTRTLVYLGKIPYKPIYAFNKQALANKDCIHNKIKIFIENGKIFVFIAYYYNIYNLNGLGQIMIIDKNKMKQISTHLLRIFDWHIFTMIGNSIMTWDVMFTYSVYDTHKREFNLFKLKYSGSASKLKTILRETAH
jgi:hypothetical protein